MIERGRAGAVLGQAGAGGSASDAEREAAILRHLPLVRYVAGRLLVHLPPHVEQEDLESLGVIGLIQAVARFDPSRGVKFETFAVAKIRGAILDGLRKLAWSSRTARERRSLLDDVTDRLQQQLGRSPNRSELAEALGISLARLDEWEAATASLTVVSLDERADRGDADEPTVPPLQLADQTADPLAGVLDRERRQLLAEAIAALPPRERLVISLYYHDGLTVKEIAQVLGVSPPRVSQLHGQAIERLRSRLVAERERLV